VPFTSSSTFLVVCRMPYTSMLYAANLNTLASLHVCLINSVQFRIDEKQSRQSITLCKMYFCTMGYGAKPPRSWGIFENLCVKSNITVCKVTLLLTVSYRKNWGKGAGCTSCSPNDFVGEQQLCSPYSPVPTPMIVYQWRK